MSNKLLDATARYILNKARPNFVKALKEYYGDNFDISFIPRARYENKFEYYTTSQLDLEDVDDIYAIVHYPELTVKNYLGEKHVIKDVYVRYGIEYNLYFTIARTTFTLAELKAGYVFSHAHRNDKYCNSSFKSGCLGSGPLTTVEVDKESSVEMFKFYFQLVTDYLQWESLGGVPYIKFSTIRPKANNTTTISDVVVEKFLTKLPKGVIIKVTNNSIEVAYTEEFELELAAYLKQNNINIALAYKVNDEYFFYGENILNLSDYEQERIDHTLNQELFYYKGEYLKTKLYDGVSIESTETLYPIPSVTKQVCNALAKTLTRAYIMSSGSIGKKDIAENFQTCHQEDSIFMQQTS